MAHNGFHERMLTILRDPWALLLSTFGGAMAWTSGTTVPLAAATTGVMLATAAMVGTLTQHRAPTPVRAGTRQQALIDLLDGHARSLRALQSNALPDVVRHKAEDALAAADAAHPSVFRIAAAVDALDEAISATRHISSQGEHATESINQTLARLVSRRATLLDKLAAAVDEVATVYAALLELSATARTMGVSLDDGGVGAVNDSVALLQATLAELETDAANLTNEGARCCFTRPPAGDAIRWRAPRDGPAPHVPAPAFRRS